MRLLATLLLSLCLAPAARADDIHVAAAISMKEALSDAAAAWQKQSGNTVQFAFGSSGAMSAQIRNSHTIDLFISAAEQQMNDLQNANLIDAPSRRNIASNTLVLVIPANAPHTPASFADLATPAFHHVAVGEPRTVPAGQYAAALLASLHLTDTLHPKLIYGANVRQVLMYVERGEANAGLVYATDALQSHGNVKVALAADPKDCSPILYPAALVAGNDHPAAALNFLNFLTSDPGQKIFAAHGFLHPPSPNATNP
ncbi:MAG: molybdate ABC transporter substrate-binding protein [Phycisphaerae bacterium]